MDVSQPKKILHIGGHDNSTWVTILGNSLTPLGQLDAISDSEIASYLHQKHYDLIILDAATLNNVETLITNLHQQQPNIPIVVMTTSPTWQRARRVLLAGATDYVRKSLDADTLLATFRAIFAKTTTRD